MNSSKNKEKVINLRKLGKTYREINELLDVYLPKSTLSLWCRGVKLPEDYENKIKEYNKQNLVKARKVAIFSKKICRENIIQKIVEENLHLTGCLKNKDTAKIVLSILYITEGSKNTKSGVMFGNSDPALVGLFLKLLRFCYAIDESKFRCTLQCRADQNINELENFWANITHISLRNFYKARIDSRTIAKPSRKIDYKGVCRINYFSSKIANELVNIGKLLCTGL